ncbi:MAG: GNAT family N-acetyltransferase [Candidatus Hodarchaeota archaeon]
MDKLESLHKVTKADIKPLAQMLSRAFFDYPTIMKLEPDAERRRKLAHFAWEVILKLGVSHGETYSPTEQLEGTAIWFHSDTVWGSAWQILRAGGLKLYLKIGRKFVKKFSDMIEYVNKRHEKLVPYRHIHLAQLGVDPELQGKKLSSKLMRAMFERTDEQGIPCFLETAKEKNVSIYEHMGFEVLEKGIIPNLNVPHWAMLRKI